MARAEVCQSLFDACNDLDRMLGDGAGESMNGLVQRGGERLDRKALEGHNQGLQKAVQVVSMLADSFVLYFIEFFPDLFRRELVMIEKRDEICDSPLKIDVVFPECVVGINEQGLWFGERHAKSMINRKLATILAMNKLTVIGLLLLSIATATAQTKKHTRRRHSGRSHAGTSGVTHKVNWAELDKKLAQWKPVKLPFNTKKLPPRDVTIVNHLVNACHYLENIFWRQSDPQPLTLYQSLLGSSNPKDQN